MTDRLDLVIYGASGFTGAHVVRTLVESPLFGSKTFAVAGRSEQRLRQVLENVSQVTGKDVRQTKIIVADSSNEESLAAMARQAKVVVNAVGPYRLYGEAVVRAAVENGASHVDISGEPAWLEKMQMKYAEQAREKGVYVVGACGWDSIPADLGVAFLKKNFGGDLGYVESFVQINTGPSGYSFNAGTYQTLILGLCGAATDGLGKIRKAIMPERLPRSAYRPPKRGALWKIDTPELSGWALPFMGADKSIVSRSQYYGFTEKKERPAVIETYIRVASLFWSVLLALWLTVFAFLTRFDFTRKILQKYPDQCSFYLFKESGPTEQQTKEASFVYWFFGYGWDKPAPFDKEHDSSPNRKVVARCDGPDAGYIATAGCLLSSALTILENNGLPSQGGVYTTASAFSESNIYEYLSSFGITYRVVKESAS